MFAEHDKNIWYYTEVHPTHLKKIDIIGFAFENCEVLSMDFEVIENIDVYGYKDNFIISNKNNEGTPLLHMPDCELIRIKLRKDALQTTKHISLDGMFKGTYTDENEIIEASRQHFSSPDIVSIDLFDTGAKKRSNIYIPWTGESEYINDAVTIKEDNKYIIIEALNEELQKKKEKRTTT